MFTFVDREKQLERYVKEERTEGITVATCTYLSNLMTNLHMSSQQALDALGVPVTEHDKYLSKIRSINRNS